jgi:uncharacterized protein (TIGR03083 family)
VSPVVSAREHIAALRASTDRLAGLVSGMDETALTSPSYDTGWSIGQVLSHLGSQAEGFELFLDAAIAGDPVPGGEVFHPIWAEWDAKSPRQWRDDLLRFDEAHVARFESLDDATVESFAISFFGMDLDLAGFARMRLSEHAVHTWDVEVMLDPSATVASDAVSIMVDDLHRVVARTGKPADRPYRVRIGTSGPHRDLVVHAADPVTIETSEPDDTYDGSLDLPAEAFLRLVYGRLDPDHTPEHSESGTRGLTDLRAVFPGV